MTTVKRIPVWIAFSLFLFAGCSPEGAGNRSAQTASSRDSVTKEKLHTLVIKGVKINVEIARTPEERERGLMFRKSMPQDRGMLFIYDDSDIRGFWMKNTYIPLSLAYIDENCRIIQLVDMEPLKEETYLSTEPAQYVLEVNRNWFNKHKVKVGDIVENIPSGN